MQFSNFADFIAMGGHGFFVWLSFGFAFGILLLLVVTSRLQQKQLINNLRAKQRREAKLKQAAAQAKAQQTSSEPQVMTE